MKKKVYVVYGRCNRKWVKVAEFNTLAEANHKMRTQVYLLGWEAASVEMEER